MGRFFDLGDETLHVYVVTQEIVEIEDNTVYPSDYYWVSTCMTMDHGLETMVFRCDETGDVLDWCDLYDERYENDNDAWTGHDYIVRELKAKNLILRKSWNDGDNFDG